MQTPAPTLKNAVTAKARLWLAIAAACACLSIIIGLAAIERGSETLAEFDDAGLASIFGLQTAARAYSLDAPEALNGAATNRMGLASAGYALNEARGRAASAWAAHKAALARASSAERVLAAEIDVLILRMEGALDQALLIMATGDRDAIGDFLRSEVRLRIVPLAVALDRAVEMRRAQLDATLADAQGMRFEFSAALAVLLFAMGFAGWMTRRAMIENIETPLAALAAKADAMLALPPAGDGADPRARLEAACEAIRDAMEARAREECAAAAARRAKFSYLAAMRQRVRAPLHAMLGMVEIDAAARARGGPGADLRDLRRTAEGLLAVVDDLIDFASIDAESMSVDLRATDAGDLLERVAVNLAGHADAKGLTLSCFVDPEIVERYKIDPLRVRQILFNLIGDAIGRTAQGGVHARLSLGTGALIFAVADSGPSMPQIAPADSRDAQGGEFSAPPGGPGLPVCRLLAARLGGHLRATANAGGGATFALELPAEPAGGALGPLPPGNALAGKRVAVLGERGPAQAAVAAYLIAAGASLVDDRREADLRVALPNTHDFGGGAGKRLRLHMLAPPIALDESDASATLLRRAAIVAGAMRALGIGGASQDDEDPVFQTARAVPSREDALARGKLILAIDADPVSRDVLVRRLELSGYSVDAAPLGEEAFAMWRAANYGLIVAELHLPDLDARELTARIRAAEVESARPRTPIVALSATADTDEIETCHAAGMDALLDKPLAWRRLVEAARRHLREDD
jgi:signal transduction histidine kinase